MPSIANVIKRFTKQIMGYWAKTGSDGYGKPTYTDPVDVLVRWEDCDREIVTPEGRKVVAKVYILAQQQILVGSLVLLGATPQTGGIALWQSLPTYPMVPTFGQGGREVIKSMSTPDINADGFVYEAWC